MDYQPTAHCLDDCGYIPMDALVGMEMGVHQETGEGWLAAELLALEPEIERI